MRGLSALSHEGEFNGDPKPSGKAYPGFADEVMSSVGYVASEGRWGDATSVDEQRICHHVLMECIRQLIEARKLRGSLQIARTGSLTR